MIDAVLRERRPAYITLAYDYGHMEVIGTPVKGSPLADVTSAHSDQVEIEGAVKAILAALATARRPVILPAFTLGRYGVSLEAVALAEATGIPFAASSLDKGVLPESHALYVGQYDGEASTGDVRGWSRKPTSFSTWAESSSTTLWTVSAPVSTRRRS